MPAFTPRRYEQILADMIAKVVARTGLVDVADSAQIKQVLAAAAREDDEQYYQMSLLLQLFDMDTATGEDLDERAKDVQPSIISRILAQKATVNLTFSRNVASASTVAIAKGTRVKSASGQVFVTTEAGSITPTSPEVIAGHGIGRDSGLVAAIADIPGAAGNVVAYTLVKFDGGKPSGVDEVTNTSAAFNGFDKESDDSFRQRIKAFISSLARSTVNAIETGVIGQQDPDTNATVLYARVVEDTINRGEVACYIDDGTGSAEATANVIGENVTLGIGIQPYQGGIVPIPGADLVDGETFEIDDGASIITFEFDDNASVVETPTLRRVAFTAGDSAEDVGAAIQAAIAASALDAVATGSFPVVVTHNDPVLGVITMSDTVADTDFVVGTITAAVGGETRLFLDHKPVKNTAPFTLTSSTRGALARDTGSGGDYTLSAPTGQLNFDPALTQGEVVTASYTYYTGLIAYIQRIVDGDVDDRTNFPGLRAAGVRVTVLTPQILLQAVNVTVTVADGYDQDEVKAKVRQAIKDYINSLSISGDVIRNELVKRCMLVRGVADVRVITPSSNVILLDDQLARTTDVNIVVS